MMKERTLKFKEIWSETRSKGIRNPRRRESERSQTFWEVAAAGIDFPSRAFSRVSFGVGSPLYLMATCGDACLNTCNTWHVLIRSEVTSAVRGLVVWSMWSWNMLWTLRWRSKPNIKIFTTLTPLNFLNDNITPGLFCHVALLWYSDVDLAR